MTIALVGVNAYLRNTQLNTLINTFITEHGDLAVEKIDATNVDYNQIAAAIESLPFLVSKKMVVVYDLSQNKEAIEKLESLLQLAGDTVDIVVVEGKPDKRSSFYKQLKKLTDFHEFNELDESKATQWLIKEANGALKQSEAQYLVQRVGLDQLRLHNSLHKLTNYSQNVTRQSIDLLTDENPTSTIFNLIDSVFSGNTKQAMKIYDEQRQLRVEPQAIHGMLVWQMHAVAVASLAKNAQDSGLSPFVFQKSQRIAKQMGRTKIKDFLKLLRDIDYKGKHEVFDYDDALRYAIIQLAH